MDASMRQILRHVGAVRRSDDQSQVAMETAAMRDCRRIDYHAVVDEQQTLLRPRHRERAIIQQCDFDDVAMDSDDCRHCDGTSCNQRDIDENVCVDAELTAKWAAFYPNEKVAVVTSASKPPLPPHGFVPLRVGHPRRCSRTTNNSEDDGARESPAVISLDTLLWNEQLLEQRLSELNAWTRRAPPTQRQKLARINRLSTTAMASLLRHWLTDELRLQRRVDVLERDLSNGVGFAEVLDALGLELEPQLAQYEDTTDVNAKMRNLERLAQSLGAAGIALPMRTRRAILMEDRAAVLQLLLQLKGLAQERSKQHKAASAGSSKTAASPSPGAVRSRVYDAASTSNGQPTLRDVEQRFVVETAQRLQPTAIAFRKDVDMAVHLRRFEQAQYAAENALAEFEDQHKAEQAADATDGSHAVRTHLRDKRAFMTQWDSERHAKWRETQRRSMLAEQADLRLELTLEARTRIRKQRALDAVQRDASAGVADFEHNLLRLGLGDATVAGATPLRAINATDAGAREHLERLEQRVEQLAFRPSNNIKMMKELRARRKAQLAAEKDRRLRRCTSSSNDIVPTVSSDLEQQLVAPEGEFPSATGSDDSRSPAADVDDERSSQRPTRSSSDSETRRSVRDEYLASKRAELEANYDQLRATGAERRDANQQTLVAIRAERLRKADANKRAICADAVDALIELAFDVASIERTGQRVDMDELICCSFLVVQPRSRTRTDNSDNNDSNVNDDSDPLEIETLTREFLAQRGMWAPYSASVKSSDAAPDVCTFIASVRSPPAALDTTWTPCTTRFAVVSVYTDDQLGDALAQRIACERGLQFIATPDQIVDECVQLSADALKIGFDGAPELSDRERDLSALGAKAAALRQKNAVLPESLVVETVATYISFMPRRESGAAAGDGGDDQDTDEQPAIALESAQQDDGTAAEPSAIAAKTPVPTSAACNGCLLLNFPRTLDEAKLLERALVAAIDDDDTRAQTLAAFESALATTESAYVSRLDAVAVIAAVADVPAATDENAVDDVELQRRVETRAQLVVFWSCTAHVVKVDPNALHADVVAELLHLSLDVLTDDAAVDAVLSLECSAAAVSDAVVAAREQRREHMEPLERAHWLRAAADNAVSDEHLLAVVATLDKMDRRLQRELCARFAVVPRMLHTISMVGVHTRRELDMQLDDATLFQRVLDTAAQRLKSAPAHSERFFTELEVALGDEVDAVRHRANAFVDALATAAAPATAADPLVCALPSLCFVLKEHALERVAWLQRMLFDHLPFLRDAARGDVALPRAVANAAITEALALSMSDAAATASVVDDVTHVLAAIAAQFAIRHSGDDPAAATHALNESHVVASEVRRLMERITALCRFATAVQRSAQALDAADIERLRRHVQADAQTKNAAVDAVVRAMRQCGRATWPLAHALLPAQLLSARAAQLPSCEQAQMLSCTQLHAVVRACRDRERAASSSSNSITQQQLVRTDEFVALLLACARANAFPTAWQSATALAVAVRASARGAETLCWRAFVFALLHVQYVDSPSRRDLEHTVELALAAAAATDQLQPTNSCDSHMELLADVDVSFDTFTRLLPWRSTATASELHNVAFELFAARGGDDHAAVALTPVLLHWCCHSRTIRDELCSFLPSYSRGLARALCVLAHVTALRETPRARKRLADARHVRAVLAFAQLTVDDQRLAELSRDTRWDMDDPVAVAALLALCDVLSPELATHFVFVDPLAALLSSSVG